MEARELIIDFPGLFLEPFNRETSTVHLCIHLSLQEFFLSAFEIDLLALLRKVEHIEARTGYDHGVPISCRRTSEKLSNGVCGIRLRFPHIEDPCPGIQVGEIRCPLLGKMLRHYDERLVGPPEAPSLHAHCDSRIGLAGADNMGHERALISLSGTCHGSSLVRPHLNVGIHAGECEV